MLDLALGWIPIIGPVIDGIVSIFNKFQDTSLGKYQVDGTVDVAALNASTQITLGFMNDIPVRIARDIIMFPGSIWCGLYVEGKIMELVYPAWVWPVKALDGPMEYLPYALLTFFFGMSAMNIWRK